MGIKRLMIKKKKIHDKVLFLLESRNDETYIK